MPILEILKDVSYRRWLIVEAEQDPAKPDPCRGKHIAPLEYAQMVSQFLRKHLGY